MRVFPPITIDETRLVDSSVMEPDTGESVYSSGGTYAVGDQVISTTTHRTYQSLVDGNHGNALPVYPETATAYWLDVGPTNKWRMFDLLRNTRTSAADEITVVLSPGQRMNSLAIVGLLGATAVTVTATSGGDTVKTWSFNLNRRIVRGWYDYFFAPFKTAPNVLITDVPPRTNLVLTISITGSGQVACAGVIMATSIDLGSTIYGAESDAINLSLVVRDPITGEAKMTPRRNIPVNNQPVVAPYSQLNSIRDARDTLNGSVALWSWIDDVDSPVFDTGLIVGFYSRWLISLADETKVVSTLELQEV